MNVTESFQESIGLSTWALSQYPYVKELLESTWRIFLSLRTLCIILQSHSKSKILQNDYLFQLSLRWRVWCHKFLCQLRFRISAHSCVQFWVSRQSGTGTRINGFHNIVQKFSHWTRSVTWARTGTNGLDSHLDTWWVPLKVTCNWYWTQPGPTPTVMWIYLTRSSCCYV